MTTLTQDVCVDQDDSWSIRIGYGVPAMLELAAGFDLYAASLQVALDAAVSIEGPVKCDRIGVDWREGTRTFVLAVVGTAKRHDEVGEVWRILNDQVSVSNKQPSVTASDATR